MDIIFGSSGFPRTDTVHIVQQCDLMHHGFVAVQNILAFQTLAPTVAIKCDGIGTIFDKISFT